MPTKTITKPKRASKTHAVMLTLALHLAMERARTAHLFKSPTAEEIAAFKADAPPPAPYLIQTDKGWDLADAEGVVLGSYKTRADAFDGLMETEWYETVRARKPEYVISDEAPTLWFDAAKVEPMEAVAGGRVTEKGIDDMVRNLAEERTPIMIDGASGISEAHESVWSSVARAVGWCYVGVKALHKDGAHIWLFGEVHPEVYEQIERGELKYGSIAFMEADVHRYTGEEIGMHLISYALTNRPYIDGLLPHDTSQKTTALLGELLAPRSRSTYNDGAARLARTRSRETEITMPTKPTKKNPAGARATMEEVAGALMTMLDIPEDTEADKVGDLMLAKVAEWKAAWDAAQAAKPPPPKPPKEGDKGRAEGEPPPPPPGAGGEGDAAGDTFKSEVVTILKDIFGQAEADEAALLDLLKASKEAFKGAIGQGAPGQEGGDAGAGASGQGGTNQPAGMSQDAIKTLKTLAGVLAVVAAKGPAKDKLTELATLLGVTMDDAMDNPWGSVCDAVHALAQAAKLEQILDGGGAPAAPPATEGQPPAAPPPAKGDELNITQQVIAALDAALAPVKAQLASLQTQVDGTVAKSAEDKKRAEARAHVVRQLTSSGAVAGDAIVEELTIAYLARGQGGLDAEVGRRKLPRSGEALAPAPGTNAGGGTPTSQQEAINVMTATWRKENPSERDLAVSRRQGYLLAKKTWPELFKETRGAA